jgi:hypothetical protein
LREVEVSTPHQDFASTDDTTHLGAQITVVVPLLRDSGAAEQDFRHLTLRCARQRAIKRLQHATVQNGCSPRTVSRDSDDFVSARIK